MERLRRVLVAGVLAVAVSAVAVGPAVAAKGGNNDTAKQCQKGGWTMLVSQTGVPFKNQGDCVNDGAQGLGVQPPPLAGQVACEQIGGSFSSRNGGWICRYPVPPNPEMPQALQDACTTDMGSVSFEPLGEGSDEWFAACIN
jgi:hypothetical protein